MLLAVPMLRANPPGSAQQDLAVSQASERITMVTALQAAARGVILGSLGLGAVRILHLAGV